MKNISWLFRVLILLAGIACSGHVFGQVNIVRVLQDSLFRATTNQQKVDIYNAIAESSIEYDLSVSIEAASNALDLATAIKYNHGIAVANKWLGKGNTSKGRSAEALQNFMDAIAYYQESPDSLELADIYKNLANVCSNNGNNREAMRYYNVAMGIYEAIGDNTGKSAILNNIGTIYLALNQPDSALLYLNQSRLSNLETKDESMLASNYSNMGYAYALRNDQHKAIEYYTMGYELGKKVGRKESMSTSLLNIGDGYMNLGEYDKAEKYVKEGLAISEKEGYKYNDYIGYYTLGEINEKRGDYKESLHWYKQAEALDIEIRNSATLNELIDLQTMQLEEAQKKEIERLNVINAQRLQTEKFKNLLYLSFTAFALLMLLGITYYFMKRHNATLKIAMQNKEINDQKEQLERQSEKIQQVNTTLRQRNKKLRELNEDKNYMMSVVAHDLKSPLNQINGLANVIKLDSSNLTNTQIECLNSLSVASSRLSSMVNKILDSRMAEKRDENITLEKVDLNKIATEVVNDFSVMASDKKITIAKKSNNGAVMVMADIHYLRQVFDNLISNAIKFSPPGKNISLDINSSKDDVITEVIDQGPGLTSEDKEKLFSEYAVLSAKPTGGESSTGLGLAIVKNYVERMGGKIWCESDPGQGASFKFKLSRA